jgi:hypothetical protein
MGQYQEWLLAQEIDRQLKTEVEALETEVLYLKDRVAFLEQTVSETDNVILQALQAYLCDPIRRDKPTTSGFLSWLPYKREKANEDQPVDAETRQNENIRRWFERWRGDMTSTERQDEQ